MIKNPECQGLITYDMERMEEPATHIPNYIFTMELSSDVPWDEEGEKGKLKDNGNLKGTHLRDFTQLLTGTKFWGYTFLAQNAKGYDRYFILNQLLNEIMHVN